MPLSLFYGSGRAEIIAITRQEEEQVVFTLPKFVPEVNSLDLVYNAMIEYFKMNGSC